MKLSYEVRYYLFFFSILIVMLILAYFSARNNDKLRETTDWVEITYEIKEGTEHLLSITKDIGTATRGYVVTGDSAFILSFVEAKNAVEDELDNLSKLIIDHDQRLRLDSLTKLINKHIEFANSTVLIRNDAELSDVAQVALFNAGKKKIDEITGLAAQLQKAQENILINRKAENDKSVDNFNTIFNLLLISAVLFLIVAFFISRHNIRTRKKAEEEHSMLFNTSVDLICIAGTDGYFKRINPAFKKTLGYTEKEILSQPFVNFVHPDDVEATINAVGMLSQGIPTINFRNRYRCSNGEYKWLEWISTPVGSTIYATARDITPRIEAEEEIKEINHELDSFSYSVSHDLRAPLRAIVGYSNVLLEDYEDKLDAEGKKTLKIIVRNGLKMGQLIDDLLSFSRVNKQNVIKVNVDMKALADSVIADFNINGSEKIEIDIKDLPPALCDSNMMKQVFTNLISNALKYSSKKERSKIEIGSFKEDGTDIYYINDNGAGFEMEHYDKLFGVFQRLHSSNEFEGTGVGLALVQRIIHKHEGKIWAEGKVAEGATFYFSLAKN